jgi:uncharacterized coiled-coil DUF342 family protein
MDQELIAYLDTRFREASQQVESLREETTQQITGLREEFVGFREETNRNFSRVDAEIRQVHVVAEGLRHEIQIVAEGVTGTNERLDAFRAEVAQEFKDVRGLLNSSYTDLDRCVRPLERRKA